MDVHKNWWSDSAQADAEAEIIGGLTMGWKNVKEHYRIDHIVHVHKEKGICIGSGYIPDIIVLGFDGSIIKKYEGFLSENADLARYQNEFESDPITLKKLIEAPDNFEKNIPIFTYSESEIIEKFCENPCWPNVTHDGCLIYENTFSTDKNKIISLAKDAAKLAIKNTKELVKEAENDLSLKKRWLGDAYSNLLKLCNDYPDS